MIKLSMTPKTILATCIVAAMVVVAISCYFEPRGKVDVVTPIDLGEVFSSGEGSLTVTHQKSERHSMYEVYWRARSMSAKPRLLTSSETFPKAGGLEDGRIWIIDSSSGDINLRIQRLSGGWNLIHCDSDDEAIIRLAELIREDSGI